MNGLVLEWLQAGLIVAICLGIQTNQIGQSEWYVIPASPRAANGRRPLAAPASVASVGAALCLKIHFFFQVNSWVAILEQLKFLSGM